MLKGNKGEWSEIYAFCYLLKNGILKAADKDLNPTIGVYFPILKIIREEFSGKKLDYLPCNPDKQTVRIYEGSSLICEVEREKMSKVIDILFKEIPIGERAFQIPQLDDFFKSIYISKLKADSVHKQDIDIQIHDIHTGISPVCGFSIKSYLGSRPTLVNPGKNTNFIYNINNCTDDIMDEVNAIDTKKKIIDRISYLIRNGCTITPSNEMVSCQFKENLEFVDSKMPTILAETLLDAYLTGVKKLSDVVENVSSKNPLHYSNTNMYSYKIKKLLCACALGMTPEKHWEGAEVANGGYIVVKRDGSVVCFHIYNRTDFEQYLYDYTCFDTPSTSRYEYMSVYKDGDSYKLKLNLQVRFV